VVVCGSLEAVPRKQHSALWTYCWKTAATCRRNAVRAARTSIKHFDFWRLFYTAFSRAQNLLVLAAQERQGRGKSPSKYFERLSLRAASRLA
jgi:DNA helicase-2/ATP-dependent DNA helicase PcrA